MKYFISLKIQFKNILIGRIKLYPHFVDISTENVMYYFLSLFLISLVYKLDYGIIKLEINFYC